MRCLLADGFFWIHPGGPGGFADVLVEFREPSTSAFEQSVLRTARKALRKNRYCTPRGLPTMKLVTMRSAVVAAPFTAIAAHSVLSPAAVVAAIVRGASL